MNIDRLRELCQNKPFQPFKIHLADGREIVVKHQEFLAISPVRRTAVVYQPDGSLNIIDLMLVADLEVKENGDAKPPRRRRTG